MVVIRPVHLCQRRVNQTTSSTMAIRACLCLTTTSVFTHRHLTKTCHTCHLPSDDALSTQVRMCLINSAHFNAIPTELYRRWQSRGQPQTLQPSMLPGSSLMYYQPPSIDLMAPSYPAYNPLYTSALSQPRLDPIAPIAQLGAVSNALILAPAISPSTGSFTWHRHYIGFVGFSMG